MREPTDAQVYAAVESDLRAHLRGKHSSVSLSFNEHASSYQTAAEAEEAGAFEHLDWTSEEEHRQAIENNSVWSLQWYPDSPVGFKALGASSLAALLEAARKDS